MKIIESGTRPNYTVLGIQISRMMANESKRERERRGSGRGNGEVEEETMGEGEEEANGEGGRRRERENSGTVSLESQRFVEYQSGQRRPG